MKRIQLLGLGTFLLFLGSCFKDPPVSPLVNIAGTWEIRSSQNGMNPAIAYLPGNDSLLVFTNTTYSIQSKGTIIGSGIYQIIQDVMLSTPSATTGPVMDRIIYGGNTTTVNKVFLQLSGNTLTFTAGYPTVDAGIITNYKKQ